MTINAVHVDCFPSCRASCCSTRSALRKNKELPKCRLAARHSPNHKRWCFPTDVPPTDLMLIRTRVAFYHFVCMMEISTERRVPASHLAKGQKHVILWCHRGSRGAFCGAVLMRPPPRWRNHKWSYVNIIARGVIFSFFCRLLILLLLLSGKITCSVLLSMLITTCTWKRLSPAQPRPCA